MRWVGGVPVGDRTYVAVYLDQKAGKAMSKINTITKQLRPASLQALYCATYHGIAPLLHHWAQHCYPDDVIPHAEQLDAELLRIAASCAGDALLSDSTAQARLRLPARMPQSRSRPDKIALSKTRAKPEVAIVAELF